MVMLGEWSEFWTGAGIIGALVSLIVIWWSYHQFKERQRRSEFLLKCARDYPWDKAETFFKHLGLLPYLHFQPLRLARKITDEALAAALWRIIVEWDKRSPDVPIDLILAEFQKAKKPGSFHAFAALICEQGSSIEESRELLQRFRFAYDDYCLEQKMRRELAREAKRRQDEEKQWAEFVRMFRDPLNRPAVANTSQRKEE